MSLTSRIGWATMHAMRSPRLPILALVLLAAGLMPELLWLSAHAARHHDHDDRGVSAAEAAQSLLHGHGHPEGEPEHEHDLLPSPPARPDPQPAPRVVGTQIGRGEGLHGSPLAVHFQGRRPAEPPGSSPPPRLQLLCTLLI
jgi:hypothetical protein